MPLTDMEKERARYHLGYMEVGTAASVQFGLPRPTQTLYLVEYAFTVLLEVAVDRVRDILGVLDGIDKKLIDAQDYLVAKRVDSIELRDSHPDLLEREYYRWAKRLADIFGVPLYPYAARFRGLGGGAGMIPIVRS